MLDDIETDGSRFFFSFDFCLIIFRIRLFIIYFVLIYMIILFFISALSIHSFLVHNDPFYIFSVSEKVENVDNSLNQQDDYDKKKIKVKTISSEKKDENTELSDEMSSDFSGNSSNIDNLVDEELSDEYEEIIFEDNFDKEYWEGTEDNYLEG